MTDKFTKFQVKSSLISGDEAKNKPIVAALPDTKITGYASSPKLSSNYKETSTKSAVKDYEILSKDYGVNLKVALTNLGEERLYDPTLFKYLSDSYSFSDINFFNVEKGLNELPAVKDSLGIEFETFADSLGSISDENSKLFITQRYDTYTTTDLLSLSTTKGLENISIASDVKAVSIDTGKLDSITILEAFSQRVSKELENTTATSDSTLLGINPNKLDAVAATEVLSYSFNKIFSDRVLATDDAFGNLNPDDDQSSLNRKPAYDFSGVSDLNYRTITKALSETLRAVDKFTLPDDTTRDTYFVSDLLVSSLQKPLLDVANYSEKVSLQPELAKLETATVRDILTTVVLFFKDKNDTTTVTSSGIVNKQDYFLEQYETENYAGENFYF
jgi:hypothetical protein